MSGFEKPAARAELILITDRRLCPESLAVRVEKILAAGAAAVLLREKDLPEARLRPLAEELAEAAGRQGRRLIVNSSLETARAVRAWGLQLPFDLFRARRGDSQLADFRIGVSIHSRQEAVEAKENGADWLLAGHIFDTGCKPGLPARGLNFLKSLNDLGLPLWAVGGLKPGNIGPTVRAGARAVCLRSELMRSPEPAALVRAVLAAARDPESGP